MTDDLLKKGDMDELSISALNTMLNKEIGKHRRLQESQAEGKSRLSTVTQNIGNLKYRIGQASAGQIPVQITDHAIVRYLERVCGIDFDVVRITLDSPEIRESVQRCPSGRHTINGVTFVTQDKALVTVIYDGEPREDAPRSDLGSHL